MLNPDVTKHFTALFDEHHAMLAAIRRTNESMREANTAHEVAFGAMRVATLAIAEAFERHDVAIAAALAANQSAMDLLHTLSADQ